MAKLNFLLFLDPIKPLEKGSHNSDVEWFVRDLLDNESLTFDKGFTAKEYSNQNKTVYKIVTLLKLTIIASRNALKAIKLARQFELTVFNPNDDPISLYILQKIRNISKSNFIIKSRFICTRDRMLLKKDSIPIKLLKRKISSSIRYRDKISAETITYSEFLSRELGIKVEFVPFPPIDTRFSDKHIHRDDDLYVSLGSARKDKGFESLPAWIDQITQGNPKAHFIVQRASKEWEGYNKALEKLFELDNVRVLPSYIDDNSQYTILASAYAVLAPYDQTTYQFRGSAFARRALYLGKPICVTLGTSMSLDAESHNLLISQDSIFNGVSASVDCLNRQAAGASLQDEGTRIWKDFLL